MNVYDSEVAEGLLEDAGYEIIRHPEEVRRADEGSRDPSQPLTAQDDGKKADVILMNTCSVREHAEDRVFSRLGMLGKQKKKNPNLIIGLMGCMVEGHKEKLFKRFPQLDLMVGTRNVKELPSLIDEVIRNRQQVARIKQDGLSIEYTDLIKRGSHLHAWLPIMTGCNKVCTFCIVPITRGSEVSMPAREVYREASRLAGEGVKWITLLGQNVNSYLSYEPRTMSHEPGKSSMNFHGSWLPALGSSFPALLDTLCQINGLEMISFTTSHPQDATEELFQVIAKNPKISRRFHLPLQSGSNRILKRMKRLHTYEDYKAKLNRLRELVPDIAITTDIITGFSGETDFNHEETVKALEEIRYDGAFIYKYSIRPATPAAKLPDDVPLEVKEKRHHELLLIQKTIIHEINQSWLGKTVRVFVQGINPWNSLQLKGRMSQDKKVVFQGAKEWIGSFREVQLTGLQNETFKGKT